MNLEKNHPASPRRIAAAAFLCALALGFAAESRGRPGQTGKGPYFGQEPPGTTPKIFAPGIVSTDAHEFSCSFTPDGKEFYFTRSESPQSPTLIMVSKCVDGVWTPPAPAAFNNASSGRPGGGMSFEAVVTPDGRRIYFSSDRPVPGQADPSGMPMLNIWYVEREGDRWSEPKFPGAPFNPMKTMLISMTKTGTIYTADISAGMGNNRIAVARLKDGAYQQLEDLGAPINIGPINNYPHVAPDESYLIFSRRERPGGAGGLYISYKAPDGTWGEPRRIDLGPLDGGQGMISPDGKYLFFTAGERRKGDIYWVEARFLTTPKTERMVDVGGRKLHACLYGQGSPTVVLVSGFNAPQQTWNPIIDPLAGEATVITYDRAGIGKSELGELPAHARQSAVDLRRLLEKLDTPGPVLLVGHSFGVRVVNLYASMFPDEVGGLILMDGVPPTILDAQKAILTGADLELLEQMTAGRTASPNARTELDYSLESLEQELRMGPLPRVPTLVLIAGANRENGVPPGFSPEARRKMAQLGLDLQKQMAADLGGKFIVFDDLGHLMHLEKPGPIVLAIKEMIQKLRTDPAAAR